MLKKCRKGYALVLVLILIAVVSILGVAALTIATSTHLSTINQHNTEQAYFTARAAVNTTAKYIQKYSSDTTKMNAIMSNTGTGSLSDMGSYTVNVSYTDSSNNTIKVSSSALYKGTKSTVVAYLTKPPTTETSPTDYLMYVDGPIPDNYSYNIGTVIGPVFVNGNWNLYSGLFNGDVVVNGIVTLSNGTPPRILGNLNYKTSCSSNGAIGDWVKGVVQKTSSYTGVNLPIITVPTLTNNVAISSSNTINSSGIITTSAFSSFVKNGTVTIDTNSGDINLLINASFSLINIQNVEVIGSHNVYIYLTGSSSFNVVSWGVSGQFIGMKDRSLPSHIFIIGDSSQNISLNNCELDANIYIPKGKFSVSGGLKLPLIYTFQGTCISNSVDIGSQLSINYSKPNITGTPLQILSTGQSGSGNWSIARWANN